MNKQKRDFFKTLTIASAAGAAWKTPVVSSFVLPAHAFTSLRCRTGSEEDLEILCECGLQFGNESEDYHACLAESGLIESEECEPLLVICSI